jgi:glycosyltransferase involved in cell wall biosynthesis
MKLDVVVPTYNRSQLMRVAAESLMRAQVPSGLDVTLLIVDNNSTDDTEAVAREVQSMATLPCIYIKETNQGASYARNAGIAAGSAEIIAFIDDDEEIDENWYKVIAREFADPAIQFIGGPYLANWTVLPPDWLPPPPSYQGVIGVNVPMPRQPFDDKCPAIVVGGNAAIRRAVFEEIGVYNTKLGRGAKGLLSGEDLEFHERMLAAGLHGMYVPDMIIYHYIPAERLTRSYYRRHTFWGGVTQGAADRDAKAPVVYLFGIPRFKIGAALKGLAALPRHKFLTREASKAFSDELPSWTLIGFIYGKFFTRIEQYYENR